MFLERIAVDTGLLFENRTRKNGRRHLVAVAIGHWLAPQLGRKDSTTYDSSRITRKSMLERYGNQGDRRHGEETVRSQAFDTRFASAFWRQETNVLGR